MAESPQVDPLGASAMTRQARAVEREALAVEAEAYRLEWESGRWPALLAPLPLVPAIKSDTPLNEALMLALETLAEIKSSAGEFDGSLQEFMQTMQQNFENLESVLATIASMIIIAEAENDDKEDNGDIPDKKAGRKPRRSDS